MRSLIKLTFAIWTLGGLVLVTIWAAIWTGLPIWAIILTEGVLIALGLLWMEKSPLEMDKEYRERRDK